MLADRYEARLGELLLPPSEHSPFPSIDERGVWEGLPLQVREAQTAQGEAWAEKEWPALSAAGFMAFRRTGDRIGYERLHSARREALASLAVAECIEDGGRFLDAIVDAIWSICEESWWGYPAHNPGSDPLPDVEEPDIDLFAGETAALLAICHNLLRPRLDAVSPRIARRIEYEVRRRILDPYLSRDDFWWMGFAERPVNNWNPWCNSSCLTAALCLEQDADRRRAIAAKAMRSLDRFLAGYPADGGCDEGPGYWRHAGGSLFDCLELLHGATGGAVDVYDEPLIGEIGRYLYRVYIDGDAFVNFADSNSRLEIDADLVFRFGRRIGDERLAALGSAAHHRRRGDRPNLGGPLLRRIPALLNYAQLDAGPEEPPYLRDAWLPELQAMTAREQEGSARGLFLAAKGGHNGEQHNHNDVGNFIVYANGQPVLIDVGVETYTAKTFSEKRYEIWTMQSAYHNLPTVGGIQQQAGGSFAAREVERLCDDEAASLSMDIAGAYPPEAGIRRWRRTVRLLRGAQARVELIDAFELENETRDVELSLMIPRRFQIQAEGALLVPGVPDIRIAFDGEALAAESERIPIEDERLRKDWGDEIYRVRFRPRAAVRRGEWRFTVAVA